MKTLIAALSLALAASAHAATLRITPLAQRMQPRATQTGEGFSVDLPIVGSNALLSGGAPAYRNA